MYIYFKKISKKNIKYQLYKAVLPTYVSSFRKAETSTKSMSVLQTLNITCHIFNN